SKLARELPCRRQNDVLLVEAVRADRSRVNPAMSGIDDDRRNAPRRRRSPSDWLRRCRIGPPSEERAKGEPAQHTAPHATDVPHAPPIGTSSPQNENRRATNPIR